jgi:phosphoglycolate phosphatase
VAEQTLLLFDVDGTLVFRASLEHAAALREALVEVHGITAEQAAARIEAAGRTDGEIARLVLLQVDVDPSAIDAGASDVAALTCERYTSLCPDDLSERVIAGIPELLTSLAARDDVRLALVTGNFETVARLKLARAGLGDWFADGQGGFGSDSENRALLPAIARGRAGVNGEPFARDATIVIGDTPRDIACARAD